MSSRTLTRTILSVVLATMIGGWTVSSRAQVQPAQPKSTPAREPRVRGETTKNYEDAEIKVAIPTGWRVVPEDEIKKHTKVSVSLGNSVSGGYGVFLEKNGYTLAVAYNTSHASGVEGGRFNEIFTIPWPSLDDDGLECSGYFARSVQPASRVLTFTNLTVDTGDPRVQGSCGIHSAGHWTEKDGVKNFEGERRWFGGFFTTADGGYFFDSNDEGCGLKAYTFTSQVSTPERLPVVGDPALKKMIQEAIDIVDSVHYKRCAPAP
jgi:hypothetical protein